jgi:hypothetical protein
MTAEHVFRVDRGHLIRDDKVLFTQKIELVSIFVFRNVQLSIALLLFGSAIVLSLVICQLLGSVREYGAWVVIAFVAMASLTLAYRSWMLGWYAKGYSVYVRGRTRGRRITHSPLTFAEAEQLARNIAESIMAVGASDGTSNQTRKITPGMDSKRDDLIGLFEEPILAGNTLEVGANEVYSGEQVISLADISRLTTTSHMPFGALLYVGYAFLVLLGIGATVFAMALLNNATDRALVPIFAWLISFVFGLGAIAFFALFLYGGAMLPTVWSIVAEGKLGKRTIYKSEDKRQVDIYAEMLKQELKRRNKQH